MFGKWVGGMCVWIDRQRVCLCECVKEREVDESESDSTCMSQKPKGLLDSLYNDLLINTNYLHIKLCFKYGVRVYVRARVCVRCYGCCCATVVIVLFQVSGRIVTGQNPASATATADAVVKLALREKQ